MLLCRHFLSQQQTADADDDDDDDDNTTEKRRKSVKIFCRLFYFRDDEVLLFICGWGIVFIHVAFPRVLCIAYVVWTRSGNSQSQHNSGIAQTNPNSWSWTLAKIYFI